MAAGLGGTDLDQIASRISEIAEMQPPQGVMEKVKALGKLRELASLGTKTVKNGPCLEFATIVNRNIAMHFAEDGGRLCFNFSANLGVFANG